MQNLTVSTNGRQNRGRLTDKAEKCSEKVPETMPVPLLLQPQMCHVLQQ